MAESVLIPGIDNTQSPRETSQPLPQGSHQASDFENGRYPSNWQKGRVTDTSYNGYTMDVCLSAIHKYINRGYNLEAVKWVLEMFYSNKYIRTWSWNVLLEHALSGIGPADPMAFLRVKDLQIHYPDNVEAIITATLILCQAKKTNVITFASLMYPALRKKGNVDAFFPDVDPYMMQNQLSNALANNDLGRAVYIIMYMVYTGKKLSQKIHGSDSPLMLVINLLLKINADPATKNNYLEMMLRATLDEGWRGEPRSGRIFLLLIHFIVSNSLPTEVPPTQLPADGTLRMAELFLYRRHEMLSIVGYGPYGVHNYVLDISTGTGKKNSRTVPHFIEETNKLFNEDFRWKPLTEWYVNAYKESKSKNVKSF